LGFVHGNGVDSDLSPFVVGIVRDGLDTSRSSIPIGVEVSTGPITTESDVDDETEILERGGDVTGIVFPESDGRSPRLRVRVTVLDVLRDLAPLESPDGNL